MNCRLTVPLQPNLLVGTQTEIRLMQASREDHWPHQRSPELLFPAGEDRLNAQPGLLRPSSARQDRDGALGQ